jgi:signal transduction histidine kinase
MEVQVNKLEELINDLLDVSRIHEGKLLLHEENINMCELIEDTAKDIIAITNTGHKIIIKNNIQAYVCGDRFRLAQVLINIINNAVKYSPQDSKIIIKTSQKNSQLIVSIKDKGVGIDKDKLLNIFNQFYQANNPIKTQTGQPGLGLGLYITSEIIRRHSGEIWVKSKIGKGSTFYFSLPTNPLL